ncbi:hypothetical protein PIB30_115847, partial [Stylosanthes scabra]|nr:hypothetical protein [Stylosanthes scabra]
VLSRSKDTTTWIRTDRASGIILTGSDMILSVARTVKIVPASNGALWNTIHPRNTKAETIVGAIQ